jgi:predicted nuclease with TOPRIM domain
MQSAHGINATVPPGALTELAALRAALPGYDVTITSRSPTHRFEAVRRHAGPGPWCLISSDPADLWRELAGRARPAARRH